MYNIQSTPLIFVTKSGLEVLPKIRATAGSDHGIDKEKSIVSSGLKSNRVSCGSVGHNGLYFLIFFFHFL